MQRGARVCNQMHTRSSARRLTHFNEKGAAYMGDRIVYAIWRDFMRWLAAHPGAGCESG